MIRALPQHAVPRRRAALAALALASAAAHAVPLEVTLHGRDGQPLADAVVFLESAAAKAALRPLEGVEIGQANKQFTERVTIVTAGTAVAFPNRDTVRHHVYSFSPAKPFELKLYLGTPANAVLFDKPGVVVLGCNIHDRMVAWVVVVETPHYARSGKDGRARFADVPSGSYRMRSWHPALPPGAPLPERDVGVGLPMAPLAVRLAVEGD